MVGLLVWVGAAEGSRVGVASGTCIGSVTAVGAAVATGSVVASGEDVASALQVIRTVKRARPASDLVIALRCLKVCCMGNFRFSYQVRVEAILPNRMNARMLIHLRFFNLALVCYHGPNSLNTNNQVE